MVVSTICTGQCTSFTSKWVKVKGYDYFGFLVFTR